MKKIVLPLALFLMLFHACSDDPVVEHSHVAAEEEEIEPADKVISLGKKLENPFTVSVMKQAYENLKANQKSQFSKLGAKEVLIEATDYYVRFLPKTDQEKELLQVRDSLTLFDMPLDYELEEGVAGAFHDPSIPENEITWQYTVVPLEYEFGEVEHEILAHLFLQDEEDDKETSDEYSRKVLRKQLKADLWSELENEAFRITGNHDDITEFENPLSARRWNPSGRILYEDNTTTPARIIPLQGAQIIIKRWFRWRRAITDRNGNFRSGRFRSRKVKCAIKWERHEWDIRSGSYGQAWYSFETLRRGRSWNKTIRRAWTPRNWLYASVHRGAMEYFYNHNAYGIRKPYHKGWFLKRRLHIGAKHKSGRGHYFTFNRIWWAAPVVVYSSSKRGRVYDSREIFATTVHELAHVSHWEIGYSTAQYVIDYLADDPFLPESWAVGVEHTITNRVYPNRGTYEFPYELDKQNETLRNIQTESDGYTPIVIDMIDNVNQSAVRIDRRIDPNRPNDRVRGYTLGQLEDALPGSFGSWWRWRTRIRQMYHNPTEGAELDYLFRQYR